MAAASPGSGLMHQQVLAMMKIRGWCPWPNPAGDPPGAEFIPVSGAIMAISCF